MPPSAAMAARTTLSTAAHRSGAGGSGGPAVDMPSPQAESTSRHSAATSVSRVRRISARVTGVRTGARARSGARQQAEPVAFAGAVSGEDRVEGIAHQDGVPSPR